MLPPCELLKLQVYCTTNAMKNDASGATCCQICWKEGDEAWSFISFSVGYFWIKMWTEDSWEWVVLRRFSDVELREKF